MNPLREAAQQALEALKFSTPNPRSIDDDYAEQGWKEHIAAVAALRAALAQQAEPVAWVASKDGRVIYDDASTDDGLLRVSGDFENDEQRISYAKQIVDKLNAAPPQQAEPVQDQRCRAEPRSDGDFVCDCKIGECPGRSAEPAQEPVAWRFKPMIGSPWSLSDDGYYISCKRDKGYIVEPLYAAPPQRKLVPLTEEEIDKIFKHLCDTVGASCKTMARAVEKASWEKNNGQA